MLEYDFISSTFDQYVIKKNDEVVQDCTKIWAISPAGRNIQQRSEVVGTCSTVIDYEYYNFGSYAGMYRWVYLDDTNETACAFGADNTDIAISNCIASGDYVDRVVYSNGHNFSSIYLEVQQKIDNFKETTSNVIETNITPIILMGLGIALVMFFVKVLKKRFTDIMNGRSNPL